MEEKYPGLTEGSLSYPPIGSLSCTLPLEVMRDRHYKKQTTSKRKKQKQTNIKIRKINKQREPTKLNKQARHPHDRATFRKNRNERKECQQNQK